MAKNKYYRRFGRGYYAFRKEYYSIEEKFTKCYQKNERKDQIQLRLNAHIDVDTYFRVTQ